MAKRNFKILDLMTRAKSKSTERRKLKEYSVSYVDYSKEKTFDGFNMNIRNDRLMQGVDVWAGYYRKNPHRCATEYLGFSLKWFQELILFAMNIFPFFMFIASRGLGKTYITALFCCIKCILYPNIKVVIVAGQKTQAVEVVDKIIKELYSNSQTLRMEIKKYTLNAQNAEIEFWNNSTIKTVTANDGARGVRSNLLIFDEFRMIDKQILDDVLRKFNIVPRITPFSSNPKYSHLQEDNQEIYLTSAWLKSHWSWQHLKTYATSMLLGRGYFLCSLPYQIAIREGLLKRTAVENLMQENTFDPVSFAIEMECKWFGGVKDGYFDLEEITLRRNIEMPVYPSNLCKKLGLNQLRKQTGEIRILSVDVALMAGKKNDATAISIMQLVPDVDNRYTRNIVYMETIEGGHSNLQAIRIKQLFKDLDIDYIVIDANGNGMAVTDQLQQAQIDRKKNIVYSALNIFNREDMAIRCQDENAPRVIYAVKADSTFNSNIAIYLKDDIRTGKLNLLYDEYKGREVLVDSPKFFTLPVEEQVQLIDPYLQTSLLIREMVELSYANDKGLIKVFEKSGNRKDRYSSLAYANYYANELEIELRQNRTDKIDWNKIPYCTSAVSFR